jgi:hypothetical protein
MLKNLHIPRQVARRDIVETVEKNAIALSQSTQRDISSASKNTSKKPQNMTHEEIEFERRDDLIYHLNRVTVRARLCISKPLIKEIFQMTHDEQAHVEFLRAYAIITKILYIRRLIHYLRQYLEYCSQCMLNQTKRHKSYEALISISSLKISFHIIIMNFVLTLSQSERKKFDVMLIVTNKFFKNKLLISEVNT